MLKRKIYLLVRGTILFLLGLSALSSCTNYEAGLIYLSREALTQWPSGSEGTHLVVSTASPGEDLDDTLIPIGRVSVANQAPFQDLPTFPERPDIEEITSGKSVLVKEFVLTAAVSLHDPRQSIAIERLKSYFRDDQNLPEGVTILPLSDIALPLRALPVKTDDRLLYVDSDSYPLVRKEYLLFETIPPIEPGFLKQKAYQSSYTSFLESYYSLIGSHNEEKSRELDSRRAERSLVWITSVGDMMFERGVAPALSGKKGLERVFQDTLPILQHSDLSVGNLEGTITSGRRATPKSYNFSFPKTILEPLKEAGFTYLMITNNHIWDYGEAGFLDTLAALKEAGIATSGAGKDFAEAARPWSMEKRGEKIQLLSLGAFPRERNGFDGKKEAAAGDQRSGILFTDKGAEKAIHEAFFTAEQFNILYVHGGWEWFSAPDTYYQELYRSFVDAGADLVVGTHPHVLQRMESYNGALIAYSLGNFIFPGMDGIRGAEDSLLLRTAIADGRILYVEPLPAKLNGISVTLNKSQEALEAFLELP